MIAAGAAMLPLVSFVIPVKNSAYRLQRLLATVMANDYPPQLIEVLVVDNESTDASAQVGREGGATVLQSSARSVAEVRNSAARKARGSILAFVDADHEITREWVRTAVDVLSAGNVAAAGAPYLTEPSPTWVQRHYDAMRSRVISREEVQWLGSGNLAIKKSVFEEIGGFDASLTACEDVDLCNRVRIAGHSIVADPGMRSVHFGDPKTLKALFYGELWRGRDNVRVTFRGPWTLRDLRSALIPIVDVIAMAAGVVAVLLGHAMLAISCWGVIVALAALRTVFIVRREQRPGVVSAVQAFAVSMVFDVAKALALLARGSHRARRSG